MKQDNKIAIVSGGSRGIGKAIVEAFASEGYNIATYARNMGQLQKLKEEVEDRFKVECFVKQANGANKEDVNDFAERVLGLDMEISALVNNTGSFIPGTVLDEEEGAVENMIETNVYSAYYLTRHLGRKMRENGNGHIFNMCSTASITAYTNGGSYCISKYALLGFSRVLREELKNYGVRVTSVLPGATFTSTWEGIDLPPERFMKAEDVANAVMAAFKMSPQSVVEEILIRPQIGDL